MKHGMISRACKAVLHGDVDLAETLFNLASDAGSASVPAAKLADAYCRAHCGDGDGDGGGGGGGTGHLHGDGGEHGASKVKQEL
eukprot:6181920-Pleurochrysis_carterae.AAC.1